MHWHRRIPQWIEFACILSLPFLFAFRSIRVLPLYLALPRSSSLHFSFHRSNLSNIIATDDFQRRWMLCLATWARRSVSTVSTNVSGSVCLVWACILYSNGYYVRVNCHACTYHTNSNPIKSQMNVLEWCAQRPMYTNVLKYPAMAGGMLKASLSCLARKICRLLEAISPGECETWKHTSSCLCRS